MFSLYNGFQKLHAYLFKMEENSNDHDNDEVETEVEHCNNNVERSESDEHKCDICLVVKKTKEALRYHMRTHDDREKTCDVCGLSVRGAKALRNHMRIHTEFDCQHCNKKVKNLQGHYKTCKKNVKETVKYSCDQCS